MAVFFDGVAVEFKEAVAAALLAADAPLVDRFPSLQILETGVAVNPELGARLKPFHKALHAHDLLAEDLEKFRILFRIREVIRRVEIGESVSFVLRDHEAAGGNRGVAAALLHLFDDQHLRARVMRCDSGTGAGSAVADHENIGFLIPVDVLGIGFRDSAGKRKGRDGGSTALKQISAVEIHNFSPGVGVSKKRLRNFHGKLMALVADELRGLMSLMALGAGNGAKVRVVVIDIAAGCLLGKLFIASAMTLEAVLRRDVFGAGRSRIVTGLAFHPLRYMAVSEKVLIGRENG